MVAEAEAGLGEVAVQNIKKLNRSLDLIEELKGNMKVRLGNSQARLGNRQARLGKMHLI